MLGGGVTGLLAGLVTSLLGGGVAGPLAGLVAGMFVRGSTALGGGVTGLFGVVASLVAGGVNGLFAGVFTALLGGGVLGRFVGVVAGLEVPGTGLPGAAAAGRFAELGGGIFLAGGAGGAALTRLELAIAVLCPIGTTCGAGFILVTMVRFASAAGGLTEAVFAAMGTRFLGGATTVLCTTWGCWIC